MIMMGLQEIYDVVSSLFVMLNLKTLVLFRIEFLVVLVTVLFLAMFIMDIFRRYIRSATMKTIFNVLDETSDNMVLYLLGAMQTAPFKNELFPVWALVLISFRYSVDFISGYGVSDQGGRRFMEYNNAVKLLGWVFLLVSRGSRFTYPLWLLLGLMTLRSWSRFVAHSLASNSFWHGKSSELLSEYMRVDLVQGMKPDEPFTMERYKYLVYGETRQNITLTTPEYVLHMDTENWGSSSITLEKIWEWDLGPLDNNEGKDIKAFSLAFALSRLLRCRLEDVPLQGDIFPINKKLVKNEIIEQEDANCAFRVMELQLAFVHDYFNTRYPMVFSKGLVSLWWNLLLSVATFWVVFCLSVDIRKAYKPLEGELAHVVHGLNVDMIITWVFMLFMMFKEVWEMASYLLSKWTTLLFLCSYVQHNRWSWNSYMERVVSFFFTRKITGKQWHGQIDQYVFLEWYDDRPKFWNLIHGITVGMVPRKDDGTKLSGAIDVPECVRPAIKNNLRAILEKFDEPAKNKVITPLSRDKGLEEFELNYFNLPTCSQVILVWHIATSICEMKLAKGHGVKLSKPGFLSSILSCFTDCCSSKSYLMDVDEKSKGNKEGGNKLFDKLKRMYIIANSLSRYCAYLLVSKPDLLPDSFLLPKMVFQETMVNARDDILKDCDSLQSKYDKLMEEADKAAQGDDNGEENEDVLRLGAVLGKKLLSIDGEEDRWDILAGVWTELLVHMAPTWNAEAHKNCLKTGGEFITHIWALLWHCGVEKSDLWPVEEVPEDCGTRASQDDVTENSNAHSVEESQLAGVHMGSIQSGPEACEENEIVELSAGVTVQDPKSSERHA